MTLREMVLLVPTRHRRLRGCAGLSTAAYAALGGTSGFRRQNRRLRYHFVAQFPGESCDWCVLGFKDAMIPKGSNELLKYRGSNLMKSQNPTLTAHAVR